MNQHRIRRGAGSRKITRPLSIHPKGGFFISLATINICICGAIKHHLIGVVFRKPFAHRAVICDIQFASIDGIHLGSEINTGNFPQFVSLGFQNSCQLATKLPIRPGNEDSQSNPSPFGGTIFPSRTFFKCCP